jgi:hypothetical protein
MKTPRLIRALGAHRTAVTDVARCDQPDTRQRDRRLRDEALDDLGQHSINRPLRGDLQRDRLQGLRIHRPTI